MTPAEETAERNACDEWWHAQPNKGASIQEAWVERARRAKANPVYQVFIERTGTWKDLSLIEYEAHRDYSDATCRIVYADQSSVASKEETK